MCTALRFVGDGVYFGRTLDNGKSYREQVIIVPRRRALVFSECGELGAHYAIIGMGIVHDGTALFFEACNERGLFMAGLNFVGNAVFGTVKNCADNICVHEFIPWVLAKCATVDEARRLLSRINLIDTAPPDLSVAQLHFMIADGVEAITVESTADGLHVYDNPVGVLTNNPPFPMQMFNLNNYMTVSPKPPCNNFCTKLDLVRYSHGLGAFGLPGDTSSQSRFVRACFLSLNSPPTVGTENSVGQFFHIMDGVGQVRGSCLMPDGDYETTLYTTCFDGKRGVMYYTTYYNRRICAVDMHAVDLDGCSIVRYPLIRGEQIFAQNFNRQ